MMEDMVKKLYGEENVFSKEMFTVPSIGYAPIYNWIWNAPVSHEETDRQLDEMVRLGIKAVAIIPEPKEFRPTGMPTMMEPGYLTPAYFEEYQYLVEGVKKRGMLFCLYDEGGWPSGRACGQVMLKHPELARRHISSRKVSVSKGDSYTMPADVLSAFDADWKEIKNGHVFPLDGEVTEYFPLCNPFAMPGYPDSPDLTRPESTEVFMELTHEGYKPYLQEHFGNVIRTVFTDEAAESELIFREELVEQFEKENGYSILSFLPELTEERPVTEEGAKARIAWFDMLGRLLRKNFLMPQREWCHQNKMAFIGHFNGDHVAQNTSLKSGTFNIMEALRCLDVPGVDVIWRQIYPDKEKAAKYEPMEDINTIFPRYASSAAAQIGKRYSLTESFGVYGCGADFNILRYVLNYQAVRGINMFNFFGISYGREGFLMGGELPYFSENHACYKDLPLFNQYAERLSYLASLGERVADVALYIPTCDFHAGMDTKNVGRQFEQIGQELEKSRVLFDVADDAVFAWVQDGKVVMGKAEYKSVVVPPCRYMPEQTKAQLRKLMAQGGQVYLLEPIPGLEDATLIQDVKDTFHSCLEISGDAEMIRLCVRQAENGKLLMLYNEADQEKTISVTLEEKTWILDAESGKVIKPRTAQNKLNLTLPSGKMVFLWQGDELQGEEEDAYQNEELLENFTFRKKDRFIIGYMQFEKEEYDEEFKPITLGDWADTVGIEFSGSGIYRTTFKAPKKSGRICLDLGEVHASCEVFVNGKSMGIYGMEPYYCVVDAEQLQDENILEIRVSNTAANEYLYTKSFEKWQSWQLGPYLKKANEFHRDSLQGGLYGPVKMKY